MKNFSNILSELLRQRGINQRMLADMVNTTEATISRYLSTDRTPRIDLIYSIAEALNVSIDYLLGRTSIQHGNLHSEDIEELISCYSKSSKDDRKVVWAVLDKYQDTNVKIAASGQDKWDTKDSSQRQEAVKKFENM